MAVAYVDSYIENWWLTPSISFLFNNTGDFLVCNVWINSPMVVTYNDIPMTKIFSNFLESIFILKNPPVWEYSLVCTIESMMFTWYSCILSSFSGVSTWWDDWFWNAILTWAQPKTVTYNTEKNNNLWIVFHYLYDNSASTCAWYTKRCWEYGIDTNRYVSFFTSDSLLQAWDQTVTISSANFDTSITAFSISELGDIYIPQDITARPWFFSLL